MKTCDTCGEALPAKMFWGEHRRPMSTCTPCRRKIKRQRRYRQAKAKEMQQAKKAELQEALLKQGKLLKDSAVHAAVQQINMKISRIDSKIRKYAEKAQFNEAGPRTETALAYQQRCREYFEEVRDLLYADAAHGIDRPLEHYLTNTYLLNKHGFTVAVTDADPREEHHNPTVPTHDNGDMPN